MFRFNFSHSSCTVCSVNCSLKFGIETMAVAMLQYCTRYLVLFGITYHYRYSTLNLLVFSNLLA
jgi:hypothetical protein